MSRRPKETFLQRCTDGQLTHEKMLNIINYQRNAHQNYTEASPHTGQNGHHQTVWRERNPPAPLMGMLIGAAIVENSMEVP